MKIKQGLLILWRLFLSVAFYPVMIGIFLWLYVTDAHWIYGLGLIAVILCLDKTWWIVGESILKWRPYRDKK